MKALNIYILIFISLQILYSCSNIPQDYSNTNNKADINPYPDSIYIPCNISPLTFLIRDDADKIITKISNNKGDKLTLKGRKVVPSVRKWKKLISNAKGGKITYEIFLNKDKKWTKAKDISVFVSSDSIDRYLVYRLIHPLYTTYEDMSISQRDIENFDETTIFDNRMFSSDKSPKCINCHSFQDYNNKERLHLHLRGEKGGTLIKLDEELIKVNPKAPGLKSGAVYPSWHPKHDIIAYSINDIGQNFHTKDLNKVEVMDSRSDLILYDVKNNTVKKITDTDDKFETFPYWSPDGEYLYYCSASFKPDTSNIQVDVINNYSKIKYSLVRVKYNHKDSTFGVADTLVSSTATNLSSTFPRVSPDGRYLLYTAAEYGNFHIWHKNSNLQMLDLNTGKNIETAVINSDDVESYHSWSSNGRWIVFSSRRLNGGYTRLFIAYFDKNGNFHKPFILPQKDPAFYDKYLKSYNIPEFIIKPVKADRHKIFSTFKKETQTATLKE